MKRILLLIAVTALMCTAISCSNDDEPKRDNRMVTINTPMVNHMVNTASGDVLGFTTTQNKLVIDVDKRTASIEMINNGDTTRLNDIIATPKEDLSVFQLSSASDPSFKGYVDIYEGTSIRYRYITADGIRVISTTPEVFFLKTNSTIVYDDMTPSSTTEETRYQFTIQPAGQNATIQVTQIVHAKDLKYFESITSSNVPITVTRNGFTISGENLPTTAIYRAYNDSTGSTKTTTNQYPFKTFNATVDLVNDRMEANFMMGASATVTATGRTYPDYREIDW